MSSVASGLLHISKLLGDRDIPSIQRWLKKVGESLPVITTERKDMSNAHQERPGKGVMYWEDESKRSSDKSPDYKGFVVLEMDYKAGEKLKLSAWVRPTARGNNLISLSEDNWSKKQRQTPQEDRSGYQRDPDRAIRPRYAKDEDVPF
jgi:hypothetical protein